MPVDWNPHLKLEFIKVCIRTVVEKIQAERKSCEIAEEDSLNEELDTAVKKLSSGTSGNNANLIEYVEELRTRKMVLVEEKGARLAEKLGTKWFNEGEKSTRYFMRLLNRALPDNFETLQTDEGEVENDPEKIEAMIVKFYKTLYEDDVNIIHDNDVSFFNHINPISDEDDNFVASDLTTAEIYTTLQTCSDSAPGPDGIPYSYLKLLWPIFGDILRDAWRYSLTKNCLPPSHKLSFIKLIPKAGKDLKRLTNWRPITLSNCDHKLLTKAYAKRLCEKVASRINGGQTAYLKNRLINDNIRALLSTINLTNLENATKGLLVALDAKKAFDSVSHAYIEKCLISFGCRKFVPIFKTLYSDLKTDIIINGKITPGFKINRGVKQGDALSCILFIMCMEPLLRNIENNPRIEAIASVTLNGSIPKVFAYADDVNCVMVDNEPSMKALFEEYERLTNISGLELNADKTELLRLGSEDVKSYDVVYRSQNHVIKSVNEIKINGLLFQRDRGAMIQRNVNDVVRKMDAQFKSWSRRGLSTLGKILIAKTFGVSQAIYLLQSISLKDEHYKQINAVLYRFIWNRHYLAAKAPERIKREIATNSVRNGGLGMLDIKELGDSLKLRALGRLRTSDHPFLKILNAKINLDKFFNPVMTSCTQVDSMITDGLQLLKQDRSKLWEDSRLNGDRRLIAVIRATNIRDLVDRRGLSSIPFFRIWARGARKVADLRDTDIDILTRYLEPKAVAKLKLATQINAGAVDPDFMETYFNGSQHKPLKSLTSKEFRLIRSAKLPIKIFKIGMNLTTMESINWGFRLAKLTSTKHKNSLLRIAHGDVYTKDKLYRFGMSDNDKCSRCNGVENLRHKFLECPYVERIWASAKPIITKLNSSNIRAVDNLQLAMSTAADSSQASMTFSAELLQTILYLNPELNYLIHPRTLVRTTLRNLATKEGNKKLKRQFIDLLNELQIN